MTQDELAANAGVSRQLVAAVESGRNTPGVDAALRLAGALGTTAEALFREPATRVVAALGESFADRARLRITRVGDQLVGAELADHGVAGAGWARADGVWEADRIRLFPGASTVGLAVAGCEPALGIAEQMLAGRGARSVLALSASTGCALTALNRGRVHAAVVHGRERHLPKPPGRVRRIHLARWQVGLAAPGKVRGELESLLSSSQRVVQRERGAAAQRAFERVRKAMGLGPPAAGPLAKGHLDSARLAVTLRSPAVTTEGAARTFGLRFLPFEEHAVELWIGERWLDHPGADALSELLASAAFTERVAQYGGYDLAGCGAVVGR